MRQPPCAACGQKCCRYVALAITTPVDTAAQDHIRWYLLHENVRVFVDLHDVWFIEFVTRCRELGRDGRCAIYEERPDICRIHGGEDDTDECEYFDTPYKVCFTSVKEFDEWLGKYGRGLRRKGRR